MSRDYKVGKYTVKSGRCYVIDKDTLANTIYGVALLLCLCIIIAVVHVCATKLASTFLSVYPCFSLVLYCARDTSLAVPG